MCIKNLKIPLNCFLFPFPQQEILFSRFVFHHTSTPTKKYHFLNEMRSATTLGLSRKFVQEETADVASSCWFIPIRGHTLWYSPQVKRHTSSQKGNIVLICKVGNPLIYTNSL